MSAVLVPVLTATGPVVAHAVATDADYTVSVRDLCAFTAKVGSLDLRFTPCPTALQGIAGHLAVAQRRGTDHQTEVRLSGQYRELRVSGRADGYNPVLNELEEVKTYRGRLDAMAENHRQLHWAQAKVYGHLMCEARGLSRITLTVVYFDVMAQTETPVTEDHSAESLSAFFVACCERFLVWARQELAHRRKRDAHLQGLAFPQLPFRPGQRTLAKAVYSTCVRATHARADHTDADSPARIGPVLRAQAPTGIGKTVGTLFPALRAMPERGLDKLFFLTAKTPGRQVALDAVARMNPQDGQGVPVRVVELVARDKSCEHPDKACHGESCPLAQGFYDKLSTARQAAAEVGWLDQTHTRQVALAHGACPYYLAQEMVRWADVVVGDYNHYFDRSALLYALTVEQDWKVTVLVDEAHNLYSRACSMYSADLTQAEAMSVRPHVTAAIRSKLDALLNEWQLLLDARGGAVGYDMASDVVSDQVPRVAQHPKVPAAPEPAAPSWSLLDELPEDWVRALQKLNGAISEHLNNHPTATHGPLLPFYFRTLSFAGLADTLAAHSLCELDTSDTGMVVAPTQPQPAQQLGLDSQIVPSAEWAPGKLTLRNIVPASFLKARIAAADSMVLFSATLCPQDYDSHLLGLPEDTRHLTVPSPFKPEQLTVRVLPVSTRMFERDRTLDAMVKTMAGQYAGSPGNYLAFFSSFDYLYKALQRLRQLHPDIPVWAQARSMDESSRHVFLGQFTEVGQGIGFAVLGGMFGEGVDLPGRRLIGAFIATLGFPQYDQVTDAIKVRMEAQFARGHDYTYVYPGIQKVVQAAGRVIRTETDTGTLWLMDRRYLEPRYRGLLPVEWDLEFAQ